MFKRLRRLEISLAAKCQLLFGAAVVLIIAAALFFPFRRMEQLMDQLNSTAAGTLADAAVREHVMRAEAGELGVVGGVAVDVGATTRPARGAAKQQRGGQDAVGAGAATRPAAAAAGVVMNGREYVPPHLVSVEAGRERPEALTKFERRALKEFVEHRNTPFYAREYEDKDGRDGYRYARPLYAERACVGCHAAGAGGSARPQAAEFLSATRPTTRVAGVGNGRPRLLGIVSVDIDSQVETNQLLLNRVLLFAAGLLAGTLATIVFYLITTRLILQPVRVLQETAERVSEGNLNIRSDISTGDEFQQLSETFNTMLENLQESGEQLRAINKNLDLKLNEMAESNLALYESNRLKNEFLANVSHELRTPLNSILGFAELLKDNPVASGDAKAVRYVQNILTSGKNLLELINDLLDLAKIEAGKMEVRSEPLSLPDLFEGLTSILKPLTEQKKLGLEAEVATDVPILHTDPAKLQQVLYNFLSNAIKFSPEGGRIDLVAERVDEGSVRIAVRDQGPGIAAEKQGVIFEKFRQLDASVTRRHSGTGLGLSISKELTGLLGGKIGVESVVGEGATFYVVLPVRIQAGSQDVRGAVSLT